MLSPRQSADLAKDPRPRQQQCAIFGPQSVSARNVFIDNHCSTNIPKRRAMTRQLDNMLSTATEVTAPQ